MCLLNRTNGRLLTLEAFVYKCTVNCSRFCSCFTMPFQVHFRQCYRGSISAMAQCIETQLMSNASLRSDLQNMWVHIYVTLLLHGVIWITRCQCAPKCSSLNLFLVFFSWPLWMLFHISKTIHIINIKFLMLI